VRDVGERVHVTPAQKALAEFMSELSEKAFFAGWMDKLEYELWDAVLSGPRRYGQLEISEQDITRLKELSEACGGWIIFDDDAEETWVPRADWEVRFAELRRR
jgi:hypothetical protein